MPFLSKRVDEWNVEDVGLFLHSLDLGHLTGPFRQNAINGRDLLKLSDEDFTRDLSCTQIQTRKIREALAYVGLGMPHQQRGQPLHRTLPGGATTAAAPAHGGVPVMGYAVPTGPSPQQRAHAAQLLSTAAQNLHKAIQAVNSARTSAGMMTGANLLARRGPRNRSAFGAIANVAAGAAQNSRLEQADMFVTQACNSIMQAQKLVPQIPSIDIAEVQRLRGGVVRYIAIPTLTQVRVSQHATILFLVMQYVCMVYVHCEKARIQHRPCGCRPLRSNRSACKQRLSRSNQHSAGYRLWGDNVICFLLKFLSKSSF